MMIIVSSYRKLKRIQLENPLVKFNHGDHKLLLTQKNQGCVELNLDTEEFEKTYYQ